MHEGSCHCGAVRLTLPATPAVATDCNCSLCRRIGGPWVYFEFGSVKIEAEPDALVAYCQGDRTLRTMHCRTCGCVTHWEPLAAAPGAKHGVNLGNFDPAPDRDGAGPPLRRSRHLEVLRRVARPESRRLAFATTVRPHPFLP